MGHSMIRQVLTRSNINQTYGGGATGGHNIYFNAYDFESSVYQSDMAYK